MKATQTERKAAKRIVRLNDGPDPLAWRQELAERGDPLDLANWRKLFDGPALPLP